MIKDACLLFSLKNAYIVCGVFIMTICIVMYWIYETTPPLLASSIQRLGGIDGISVNNFPVDIAVNPYTNRLYVTNEFSNTVSVIDTRTDQVVDTIAVGILPYGIAIDTISNRIFVSNIESDTVSVIDGPTNKVVSQVTNLSNPVGITINPFKSLVYVSNIDNGTVTVIDEISRKVQNRVSVGNFPYDIAVYRLNSITDLIYVTNTGSNTVSVINSSLVLEPPVRIESKVIKNITVGRTPAGVAVDQQKGLVYVTNKDSNTVTIIDTSTNNVTRTIPVGIAPVGVAVNNVTGKAYVSNTFDNTISVIDASASAINKIIQVNPNINPNIQIPRPLPAIVKFPNVASFVAINTFENMIYVTNTGSNKISEIDGSLDELVLGVSFNVEPESTLGYIRCENSVIQNDDYVRYPSGQEITCEAQARSVFPPPPGFGSWSIIPPVTFDYWATDLDPERSTDPIEEFTIQEFGTIKANFKELPNLFQLLGVTVAVLTAVAAALYSKRDWIHRKQYVDKYLKKIEEAYRISNHSKTESLELFREIKKASRELFVDGKINQTGYFEIDKKINEYRNKIENKTE
jgi:YVTN family beta-propeller protein